MKIKHNYITLQKQTQSRTQSRTQTTNRKTKIKPQLYLKTITISKQEIPQLPILLTETKKNHIIQNQTSEKHFQNKILKN